MNESRIEELEIKLSFQDELIGVLNQQVSAQELRLITLERKLQVLAEMLLNLDSGASTGTSAKAEVPPHY
jgi:SlyX protein